MSAIFKVRRNVYIGGGSAQFGSDSNLYRVAANRLKTDDALTVGGSATVTGQLVASGKFLASGTPFVVAYGGTASPSVDTNGQVAIYHKANVARLVFQSGGTAYAIALPTATNGTVTVTVNSVP